MKRLSIAFNPHSVGLQHWDQPRSGIDGEPVDQMLEPGMVLSLDCPLRVDHLGLGRSRSFLAMESAWFESLSGRGAQYRARNGGMLNRAKSRPGGMTPSLTRKEAFIGAFGQSGRSDARLAGRMADSQLLG